VGRSWQQNRPATALGRVAEKHMQAAQMFHKCRGSFADFSQNKVSVVFRSCAFSGNRTLGTLIYKVVKLEILEN